MKHINKNCNHCGIELVLNTNYSDYRYTQRDYSCKTCYLKITKEYNKLNNKIQNALNMYVNGKYVSRKHPLYKAGRYKTFEDLAFGSLPGYSIASEGHVYILTNPAWKGWLKVGMAIDATDRCKQYQTSSPLRDYKLQYQKVFSNRSRAEQDAHKLLVAKADKRNGEWFKISVQNAKNILEKLEDTYA